MYSLFEFTRASQVTYHIIIYTIHYKGENAGMNKNTHYNIISKEAIFTYILASNKCCFTLGHYILEKQHYF